MTSKKCFLVENFKKCRHKRRGEGITRNNSTLPPSKKKEKKDLKEPKKGAEMSSPGFSLEGKNW